MLFIYYLNYIGCYKNNNNNNNMNQNLVKYFISKSLFNIIIILIVN